MEKRRQLDVPWLGGRVLLGCIAGAPVHIEAPQTIQQLTYRGFAARPLIPVHQT
jgi:hypothetical protein